MHAETCADCIAEVQKYIYIFEFKLDQSADIALEQIDSKGCVIPYKSDPRALVKVGINFRTDKRNIGEWKSSL